MSNKLAWILGIVFFWEIVLTFYLYTTKRWKTFWLFLAVYFLPMFLLAHMVTFSMASALFRQHVLEKLHLPSFNALTKSYNYMGLARSFDPEAKEMHGVLLTLARRDFTEHELEKYDLPEKGKIDKIVSAERAKWLDGKWVFYGLHVLNYDANGKTLKSQTISEVVLAIPETLDDFLNKPGRKHIGFMKKIKREKMDEIIMQINQASSRGKTPDRPL
ncbi:MAG: hypothetical protein WCJ71_05040 [Candidatus Omnitrophota bacterium]